MTTVLIATGAGLMAFSTDTANGGAGKSELPGKLVRSIVQDGDGSCLAVVDSHEIWRRSKDGVWSQVTSTELNLELIACVDDKFLASTAEANLVRVGVSGAVERLPGFDAVEGRSQWFAQGPPLHVRALTTTADGGSIMAAVHVGGIPRSTDGGASWAPTVPIDFDVHEVKAHPRNATTVAAAAAVGLCVSFDSGETWNVLSDGPEDPHSLAVAFLDDEALFSVQDGPFAERSQVWRWRVGENSITQVNDGLPQWLDGKIDTAHIAAGSDRAAVVDGDGSLWLSERGSCGWTRIATQVPYVFAMLVLAD